MYPGEALLARQAFRAHFGFGNCFAMKDNLSAMRLRRFDLHEGGGDRHDYRGRDAQPRRVISNCLCIIPRRHRDDALRALRGTE